jgi:hypothetical protein
VTNRFVLTSLIAITAFTPALAQDQTKSCAGLTGSEKTACESSPDAERKDAKLDAATGVEIVERDTDTDWKNTKANIPWSSLVKVTSKLGGDYYYVVFDRDYKTNSGNGMTEGVITRWTNDTVSGYQYMQGGCGWLVCTYGSDFRTFSGTVEIYYSGKSYLLYGNDGEYQLPQELKTLLAESKGSSDLSLKLSEGRGNQRVFPIGGKSRKAIAALFTKEDKSWELPQIAIKAQKVSPTDLQATKVVPLVLPSVVSIRSDRGLGSGFVFTDDGLILTNRHVVSGSGVKSYEITTDSGAKAQGKVIFIDKRLDFAIIKPDQKLSIPKLPVCYKSYPVAGEDVIAIGSPDGIAGTVTKGVVSAVRKPTEQLKGIAPDDVILVQHDAAISPGNSGGPLVNAKAEVLGVNTYGQSSTAGGRPMQNINFAISIVDVLRSLRLRAPALPEKAKSNECGNLI